MLEPPVWCGFDHTSCQTLCPLYRSTSLQSAGPVSTDCSTIQLPPFESLRPTIDQLQCGCTHPEISALLCDTDRFWDFPVMGHPRHQHYHRYQHRMSTVPHLGVLDCHGVRHVTSSLPVSLESGSHATLSGRGQLTAGDYRNLTYQQADMRTADVTFPVAVEMTCKPSGHLEDVSQSDSAKRQVRYDVTVTQKRHDLEPTTQVVGSFYFY